MSKLFRYISVLILSAMLLAACAPAATLAPTAVPATATTAPTAAPAPTATTAPTAVPPTPVPATATAAPKTIVDIAAGDPRFSTLVKAVTAAGLVDTLKGAGPFTVFAPTDEAFAKLPAGTLDALLKDIPTLKNILLYHVVSGSVMAADVVKLTEAKTAANLMLPVKVDGMKVMVGSANVTATDIKASNGVIHVIDSVLLPPKDIVDTAAADKRFSTLVKAVTAAGLVDTLKGAGPYTVFAPTDEAFAKLPAGTLDALLKDTAKLKDILLYHVVKGKVMAADVVKLKTADTVQGKPVTIKVDGSKVYINDAQVIITDIQTANGVIHVIDTVLLPPAK